MAEIINLRRARKAKSRNEAEAAAAANRAKFGRTRADIERTEAEHDKAVRHLDGHLRDADAKD